MTDNASFFAGQAAGPVPALPLPGEDLTDAPTAEPAEVDEEDADDR